MAQALNKVLSKLSSPLGGQGAGLLLCGGFFCTLFTGTTHVLNGVLVGLMGLWGLFYNSPAEKWQLFKQRPHLWFMVAFFVWLWISLFLSENQNRGFRYMDTRLALFYLPVSMGLLTVPKSFRDQALLVFAGITVAALIYCFAVMVPASVRANETSLLYNDSLSQPLYRQSIYMAVLVNISIFILGYWSFYKQVPSWAKACLGIALLFLFICSYFLASRNALIVLVASLIAFCGYEIVKRKSYLLGATMLLALLMGAFTVYKFSPKTVNRFREMGYTQYNFEHEGVQSHYNMAVTADQWNGANLRLALWRCGWEVFLAHPLTGVGLGDKLDAIMSKYQEKNFSFAARGKYNVHSNYLDILYSTGLIGLLLMLAGWVVLPLQRLWRNGYGLGVLIVANLAIAFITEIYFDRTIGGMVAGFFIPFLLNDVINVSANKKAEVI